MIADLAKYVIKSLFIRITRSSLTILSIMMGIMAIFALLSFGQGLKIYVDSVAEDMGTDKLIAQPRGASAPGSTGTYLSQDDLDFIAKQNGVKEAVGLIMSQAEVKQEGDGAGKWVWVMGYSTDTENLRLVEDLFLTTFPLEDGRFLDSGDRRKATLGHNYQEPDEIFRKPLKLGDKLYVNDIRFDVVGFHEEVGNPQDDANVIVPLEDAKDILRMDETEYGMIYIQGESGEDPSDLAEFLEDKLRRFKDQEEGQEDFNIQTLESQLEAFNQILNVLNGVLVLIAAVSVLVAAVNIANTMYTAVMERTKEIGVMKAIGARNTYIMGVFVFESGLLGILGGLLGIGLGYLIARVAGNIAANAGYSMLQPAFPLWLIASCLMFAFLVGAGSGFFPARQASMLKPVDALRDE